jgi:hypothetical protein
MAPASLLGDGTAKVCHAEPPGLRAGRCRYRARVPPNWSPGGRPSKRGRRPARGVAGHDGGDTAKVLVPCRAARPPSRALPLWGEGSANWSPGGRPYESERRLARGVAGHDGGDTAKVLVPCRAARPPSRALPLWGEGTAQLVAWRAALRGRRRQPTVCVNTPRRLAAGVAGPGAAKVSSLGRGYAPRSSSFRRPPCLVPRRIRGAPRERYSPTPTRYLKGGPPRASGGNEPVGGTRRSPGCFACTTRRTITHENATAKSPGDEHVSDRRAACAGRTDLTTP